MNWKNLCDNDIYNLATITDLKDNILNANCDYIDINYDKFANCYNFNILQLNIRGLIIKQSELIGLLSNLSDGGCNVDIVCLCETFFTDDKVNLLNILNYDIQCINRKQKKKEWWSGNIKQKRPRLQH